MREQIMEIFARHREEPDGAWGEDDFLTYLVRPDGKPPHRRFRWKYRKDAFFDDLQTEFSVCFPFDVYDHRWDFPELVAYVDERMQKPTANLKMAQSRLRKSKYSNNNHFLILNLILLPLCMVFNYPFNWLYLLLPISLNMLMLRRKMESIAYARRLLRQIADKIRRERS